MRATAVAQPNIALIKYWGKRHEELIIPATGSLSLTLDAYPTTTTVELRPESSQDTGVLDGRDLAGAELGRVTQLLSHVRRLAQSDAYAHVHSSNTVPTAAGLASSAAGFAALAVAAGAAYGLDLSPRDLSRLARRGSGSASRSIFGGMVRWNAGDSDETSYAEPLRWGGEELNLVIARVSSTRKDVSSREGMQRTIATSPFYAGWVTSNTALVDQGSEAVADGDLERLGALTELSTMRMHATMLGADPPLRYLTAESFALIDVVRDMRNDGMIAYATADAGPNVKILTTSRDAPKVEAYVRDMFPALELLRSSVGEGARVIEQGAV